MKVISYLCCWLTPGLCSTLAWRMRRGGKDVKNLKSTFRWKDQWSLANAQDLRQGYLQVTQVSSLCISTENGSLMHWCENFTLSQREQFLPFSGSMSKKLIPNSVSGKRQSLFQSGDHSLIEGLVPVQNCCSIWASNLPRSMRCRVAYGELCRRR